MTATQPDTLLRVMLVDDEPLARGPHAHLARRTAPILLSM